MKKRKAEASEKDSVQALEAEVKTDASPSGEKKTAKKHDIKLTSVKKQKVRTLKKRETIFRKLCIKYKEKQAEKNSEKEQAKRKISKYYKAKKLREKQKFKEEKKLMKSAKYRARKEREHEQYTSLLINRQFKFYIDKLTEEFNVTDFAIYTYSNLEHADVELMYGTECCTNDIVLLKYFSFDTTTVLANPCGIEDDTRYKSRFFTRFEINSRCYLTVLSSVALETFRTKNSRKIIDYTNQLIAKVSDIIEHSARSK